MTLSEKQLRAIENRILEGSPVRKAVSEAAFSMFSAIADKVYNASEEVKMLANSGNFKDLVVYIGKNFKQKERPFTAREVRRLAQYLISKYHVSAGGNNVE